MLSTGGRKQFPPSWVPSSRCLPSCRLTARLSNAVTFPPLPGFFHPSASVPFCRFLLFLQAIAAAARRWLKGEARGPKFNRYPTKPGSSTTNLVPGPSNTAVKPAGCGDLPCGIQMNPPGQPRAQGIPGGFREGVCPGQGEKVPVVTSGSGTG